MNVYTYTEARQKLAKLLDEAERKGEVKIRRKDGRTFVVRAEREEGSPLDVKGIDLGINAGEILECIEEGRGVGKTKL